MERGNSKRDVQMKGRKNVSVLEIFFQSTTNKDATIHNLFISVRRSACFRRVFPSIISSSKLHIQRQVFVRPLLLPAASLARPATVSSNGLTNT